jgi:hypothetical protein
MTLTKAQKCSTVMTRRSRKPWKQPADLRDGDRRDVNLDRRNRSPIEAIATTSFIQAICKRTASDLQAI